MPNINGSRVIYVDQDVLVAIEQWKLYFSLEGSFNSILHHMLGLDNTDIGQHIHEYKEFYCP